jgi:hypothetical protein
MSLCRGFKSNGEVCKVVCNSDYCYSHVLQGKRECCVCLDTKKCVKLECKHNICEDCLYSWSVSTTFDADCPLCRTPIEVLLQEQLIDLAVSRQDAREVYRFHLNISREKYNLISNIDFDFGKLKTRDEINRSLDKVREISDELCSRISQEKIIVRTTCHCIKCQANIEQPDKNFFFYTPPFLRN